MPTARIREREASLRAVITRADGSREDWGVIAYSGRNPFKKAFFALDSAVRRFYYSRKKTWQRLFPTRG